MIRSGQIWITKSLSQRQINYAQKLDLKLTEVPQIEIQYLDFPTQLPQAEAWIFTSQNAVMTLPKLNYTGKIYASGKRTAIALKKKGFQVISSNKETALSLAEKIISDQVQSAIFFCGDKRRDELPQFLKKNNIVLSERIVYKTILTPTHINAKPSDAIFFLSPSAIESFEMTNSFNEKCSYYCIGQTTADVLKLKNIQNIHIAKEASLEAMLEQYTTENN